MAFESSPISPVDDTGNFFVDIVNNLLGGLTFPTPSWEMSKWEQGIGD